MKKIVFRILAFLLDLGMSSLIILGLSYLTPFNPEYPSVQRKYKAYYRDTQKYDELLKSVDVYFEDEIISTEEYENVKSLYSSYLSCFDSIELDSQTKSKDILTIKDNLEKRRAELSNALIVSINKMTAPTVIISLIVYILYFGVLQYLLKGQTPFKRIFRLKVIKKDGSSNVSLISYIIRSILITEIIISLVDMVLVRNLTLDAYVGISYSITQVKYVYEMAFIVCMILRDDLRSVHDLILNTKVIRYDKSGHEIKEQLFKENDENILNKAN